MLNFLLETFLLGLRNLHLHKLRSLLTALGIIIGVAAFIVMVAIGEGSKQAASEQMRQLGAQNILLRSVKPPESNEATGKTQRVLEYGLKRSDFETLKTLPHVTAFVRLRDTEQKVIFGDVRATANAIGTTPEAFEVMNLPLERGRFFTQLEYEHGSNVCVIGARAAQQLFPYQDPMGATIQIGTSGMSTILCTIVGVLQPTGLRPDGSPAGAMIGRNLDEDVYFPLNLAQSGFGDSIVRRQAGSMESKKIQLSEIWLRVDDVANVETVANIAENILRRNHNTVADVEVKAPIQILRNAEQLNRIFNFVMGGIAALSLVVGGIGIMNIMLAAVTERTREIGIRRALGAKRRHITLQFLIETTVVSLTGGTIGVALGVGLALGLPLLIRLFGSDTAYRTSIAMWSAVSSFIVSGLIGVGFGLYPAIIAAMKNPIESLRHE
jgi:putative ABC transport system permease protein